MSNPLIFGKSTIQNIVSCEVRDSSTELFLETEKGITTSVIPNQFWILAERYPNKDWTRLKGELFYKYIKYYDSREEFEMDRRKYKKCNIYSIYDEKEAGMVKEGFTYYKGMKVKDVSVLSFDIETVGLTHNQDSKVLLISNTFRKGDKVIRKLFSYDDYATPAEMFLDWSEWVYNLDPSIITGHNIFCYDLPYMQFCAERAGTELYLGRDASALKFNNYESDYRIDGSMSLTYKKAYIYGREIVDTLFLAYKYDIVSKKYENYRLKSIISKEGLEVEGRQFYDAATIKDNYTNPGEWAKIKDYAIHDADDALSLFDLMVPAYFYLNQSIPKSFQSLVCSATGSQINSLLMRSYLQEGHSLPKQSDAAGYEGAISLGNPGVYRNVFKIDVASLYPSIMLQYEVYDSFKDPNKNFLKMVSYFTAERLENKSKAKETGDKYYKDLEQAQKIVINSAYGMLGTPGLLFNSPSKAAFVTRKGREILQAAIDWSVGKDLQLVNADTDSISVSFYGQELTEEDRTDIIESINNLSSEKINWEDDGYYEVIGVIKIKNYFLKKHKGDKVTIKGSALKMPMKEAALREFGVNLIQKLIENNHEGIVDLYHLLVKEIFNINDISRWCTKKTITSKVLNPERTNEQNVLDAIEDSDYTEGDKAFFYFNPAGSLTLQENWNNDHDIPTLLEKLFKTVSVFKSVLDISKFPNYSLVRNQNVARSLVGLPPLEKEKKTRKKKDANGQDQVCEAAAS